MSIKDVSLEMRIRQIQYFLKADERYGRGIAKGRAYEGKAILELEVWVGAPD